MKLNIQWKKVLYGIALIVIGIILAALHFIVAGKGIGFLVVALIAVGLVFNAGVALHLPIKHKRYLRLKGAASTTALTAGAVTCYLSDVFDARFIVPKEGIEFIATTD